MLLYQNKRDSDFSVVSIPEDNRKRNGGGCKGGKRDGTCNLYENRGSIEIGIWHKYFCFSIDAVIGSF